MRRAAGLAILALLAVLVAMGPAADAAGLTDLTAPTITGTAQVGLLLSAQPGTWTPAPTAYAYHWLRDGLAIPKATDATYAPGPNDVGHALSVEVDAADGVGDTGSATSAPTAAVAAGDLRVKGGQKVVGVARYTHTLTVHPGRFSPRPTTIELQWLRDGRPIAGATDATYPIRPEDVGARLAVLVTAEAPGYATEAVRTRPTAAVRYRVDVRRTVSYHVETRGHITASVARFRAQAQQTYEDARGWRSSGIAFRPVAHGGSFTLVLSQASLLPSFSSSCSSMWSCRVGRYVIINQDRWLHASPAWNAAHQPLRDYRDMVVNHETGHWLGLHHVHCPGPGRLAPVMMQQSKGLEGCRFNPWPLPSEIAGRTPHARSERVMVAWDRDDYARVESD